MERIARLYAGFVHKYSFAMLLVILVLTITLALQIPNVTIEPMDYKTFLPPDSQTMEGMNFVEDTFMSTDSAQLLIMKRDGYTLDWGQEHMISFVERLEQALNKLPSVDYTLSYVGALKQRNNGSIRIGRQEFHQLTHQEKIMYPIDPLAEAQGYVTSFDELDEGITRQYHAIQELHNASGVLVSKIEGIRAGAQQIKASTDAIYDEDVSSASELADGIQGLKRSLQNVSRDLGSLNEGIRSTYCDQTIVDPIYQDDTGIPNPYYNQSSCHAYQNKTIQDSYESLRDTYCAHYLPSPPYAPNTPNPYYNLTRCNTYNAVLATMDKNFSYYEGLTRIKAGIDTRMIPALEELEAGTAEAAHGLEEFKTNIIEINKGMAQLTLYLQRFKEGMMEYERNMAELEQQTAYIKGNVSSYNQQISSTYHLLKETIDYGHEAQDYKISDEKEFGKFFSKDGTAARIHILIRRGVDKPYIAQKLQEVADSVKAPGNVEVLAIGDMIRFDRLQSMIPHQVSSTSLFATIFIIAIIIILIRRPIMSLLTLSTILFGTLWTFGILGSINMNLNPASAGILSMLLGIGIDFGIQIISEFIKFFKSGNLESALAKTFQIAMTPILITTGSALLGFFAMGLADVTIMQDMSRILMLGTPMYFIAAFTVLPAALAAYINIKEKIRGEQR
ncbi:MAG: MMPL family transporter [Nanobdellota archaeon]